MPHCLSHIELPAPIDVLGMPIRPFSRDSMISTVVHRAQQGIRTLGMYANAHTMNLAHKDLQFRRSLSHCDLLYADGASVVWASRLNRRLHDVNRVLPQRLTAADHFPHMIQACASAGLSVFLLGSLPGVSVRAAERLISRFPLLKVAGTYHGHFDLSETDRVIAEINAAAPDILFAGMSSPRQEFWLSQHSPSLKVPVRWCVGALFDYIAGLEPRGPAWLCDHGGEWLARLLADPRGKWKRYLLGNPKFLWHVLRWRYQQRRTGRDVGVPAMSS